MPIVKRRERGAALVLVTFLSAFLLIPLIGIAVDGSILYWAKAKISAAVDSAALSGARSLNLGTDWPTEQAQAITTGTQYFWANFPNGMMRTSIVGGAPTITPVQTSSQVITVTATATATVPLYFMPLLGFSTGSVSATGQATRRNSNIMLVLDRSNSMNNAGSCAALISSAGNFVNQFVNGRDQVGLVTFQTSANVDFAPTLNFKTNSPNLNSVLSTLICAGATNTTQGLNLGYQQIENVINEPGALNVILFFTDGQPSAIDATFQVKLQTDSRYGSYPAMNTSSIVSTPPSSCNNATVQGVLTDVSTETATSIYDLNTTGFTAGLYSDAAIPINSGQSDANLIPFASGPGCNFRSKGGNGWAYPRADVAAIPATDLWNDSTSGYIPYTAGIDLFPTSNTNYANQIRPDVPRTVRWAAFNAADSFSQRIRNDTTYSPIIYTIGLQGNETMAIDQDFMERLANDPRASNYDSTKPQGQFILATNTGELSQAFQTIASEILRLSK